MKPLDSRRLTGANLLLDGAGAVVDVDLEGSDADRLIEAWERQAGRILGVVGWPSSELAHRIHAGGVTLAFTAPIDALYAATEVNEWALSAAIAEIAGNDLPDLEEAAARLLNEIAAESNPRLIALRRAAIEHGVACLSDDDHVSVGLGSGSLTWVTQDLPVPDQIEWQEVHDVPVALVTGTNGKTTTVRLLASIVAASGKSAGLCSTDWIRIGDALVEKGDYSGPGGARQVLRHPRVEIALLETARGGMLRRGLAVEHADVALVTNIAEDHLGESGIYDLEELAQAKLIVHKCSDVLALNADDPLLVRHGAGLGRPTIWFSLEPENEVIREHRSQGGRACRLVGGQIVADHGPETQPVTSVASIPITLGGAARHNISNVLGALAVSIALDLPIEAIRSGLEAFESNPEENPGRMNVLQLGGVTAVVDFAHNPHGVAALLEMAAAMPANRRLVTTGQAGDRTDESIRSLGSTIARNKPDRVIVKNLDEYRRGRPEGEAAEMIIDSLRQGGLSPEAITRAGSEMDAIRQALTWARDGDLLLLITHSQRSGVLSFLERLQESGWTPGHPVDC